MADIEQLYQMIRQQIHAAGDAETQARVQQLTSGARTVGMRVPDLRAMARAFKQTHPALTLAGAADLMDRLCQERWREEILFGAFLLGRFGKQVAQTPWPRIAHWTEALDNWETCDQLASNVSGPVVAANLALVEELLVLTASANLWQRRFAVATAVELNHKGRSHPEVALRVCRPLLADPAGMVRKAVGWALKEASQQDAEGVLAFLLAHRAEIPAPVLREAASKLLPAQRRELGFS